MADGVEYTTLTRYIDVEVFLNGIEGYIRSLIRKYGHKNCGLMHVELCDEIKNFITETKKLILKPMDGDGRKKWNREWGSKKNEFFNKLFQDEGFTYMCDSRKNTNNPRLSQLKSKHIDFCKERDAWKATVKKKNEFDECVKYNQWIEAQKKSFHQEYLNNVREFRAPTVEKYFITKDHPGGHDPRGTYQNSKLNCTQYKPPPISHPQIPVAAPPQNSLHSHTPHDVKQVSKEKNRKSMPDLENRGSKIKSDVSMPLKPNSPIADSGIPTSTKIQSDGDVNGRHTGVNSKVPVHPNEGSGSKKEVTSMNPQQSTDITPSVQTEPTKRAKTPPQSQTSPPLSKDINIQPVTHHLPSSTATTSSPSSHSTVKDTTSSEITPISSSLTIIPDTSPKSGSLSPPDQRPLPLPPATERQDNVSYSTPGTSSDTQSISNPTKSAPSTTPVDSSLSQPKDPVLIASPVVTSPEVLGAPASPSVSTNTTTVTTTTTSLTSDTISTMNTEQPPKSSTTQVPDIPRFSEAPPAPPPSGAEITTPAIDKDTEAKSTADESPKPEGSIKVPGIQLPVDTNEASRHPSIKSVNITDSSVQKIPHQINQQNNTIAVQQPSKISVVSSTSDKSGRSVNIPKVNTKTSSMDDSAVRTNKNDNPSIIPEGIPPLTHIIPTLLVILGTLALLFQLYKYTPFGFLLGRRRKRKKRDLRRTFVIPEESTYESPNITVHELEGPNLLEQTVKSEEYVKLLKINRYKQEMQKRNKENKKTLIEVHMEVLEEYKSAEWGLHKGDFLEICLRGFINEENDNYSKLPNTELTAKSTKNDKIIENIQKHEILWNNWIENHRNILEQWKKEDWFQNLKNEWKNEEQMYKEKNDKLQKNILNEQDTHSIVSQKEIWKQWISKQATLMDMFNKEDWFKSMAYAQNIEKNNYHINEYNNTSITSKTELKNEKRNHECDRRKNIIQKLMVQIHMMVLEECIKEDIIKHKELCIDNFIEEMHNNNNYDEKRNIPQCDTDDFNVLKYDEIHTSRNK
ncbi:STP1 protein [Plasmodium ovale wallikeri]|uniref:STP1 protein n=1 Tax=Plasmodium ovale wallikeri TaxID=864142 RepID=A0A1A9AKZ1_PLAOA|nr:STP1 protein [Plasmodium ovale wallikeri]